MIASAIVVTVFLTFYFAADSKCLINFHGHLEGWTIKAFLELLALKNAIAQCVVGFLIIEPARLLQNTLIEDVLKQGLFHKKLGFANLLIAMALVALVAIGFFFGEVESAISWAMTGTVAAGFVVPYLVHVYFSAEEIEALASESTEDDERQAELGVDHDLWELNGKVEPLLFMAISFFMIGISRMLMEHIYVLSLRREDIGVGFLHAFKSFELGGIIAAGIILIFFRRYVSPPGLIIGSAVLQVIAQANMLNFSEDVTKETLLLITMILTALAEGCFLMSICTHIHEEYGTKNWGQIFAYMITSGAAGIAAFDGCVVFLLRQIFGTQEQQAAGQSGIFQDVIIQQKDFTTYDSWLYLMFFATLAASVLNLGIVLLSSYAHRTKFQDHSKHHQQANPIEMQVIF